MGKERLCEADASNKKTSANIIGAIVSFLFIILAILLLIGSFLFPDKISTLRAQATNAIAPAITAITHPLTQIQSAIQNINDYVNLKNKYRALKADNEKLMAWYLEAQSLQAENKALRKLAKISETKAIKKHKILTTTILNDTSADFAKSVIIRAGYADKISKDSVVVSPYGLAGRVVEATDHNARVMLITDINSRVPVMIHIDGQLIHALLAGQNNDLPIVTHIKDQALRNKLLKNEGTHAFTSGTGGLFPYGIPVGRLHIADNGSLQIKPYMKSGSLFFVDVLKSQTSPPQDMEAK